MKKIVISGLIFILFINAFAGEEWSELRSTHFIIYYKDGLGDFAEKVVNKAERLYDEIADYLGFRRYNFWLWEERAKVYIYKDAQEYHSETGQPEWSAGCALTKEKIIKTYPLARNFLNTVLPHEIVHIIFREFVGCDNPNIPFWLDEGVAGYQEKSRRFTTRRIIKEAMRNNKFIGLEELANFNPHDESDKELVDIFYAEAISLVDYLIKQFGRDNFASFCRALRDKKTLSQALSFVYNFQDTEKLYKAWHRYLKNE